MPALHSCSALEQAPSLSSAPLAQKNNSLNISFAYSKQNTNQTHHFPTKPKPFSESCLPLSVSPLQPEEISFSDMTNVVVSGVFFQTENSLNVNAHEPIWTWSNCTNSCCLVSSRRADCPLPSSHHRIYANRVSVVVTAKNNFVWTFWMANVCDVLLVH